MIRFLQLDELLSKEYFLFQHYSTLVSFLSLLIKNTSDHRLHLFMLSPPSLRGPAQLLIKSLDAAYVNQALILCRLQIDWKAQHKLCCVFFCKVNMYGYGVCPLLEYLYWLAGGLSWVCAWPFRVLPQCTNQPGEWSGQKAFSKLLQICNLMASEVSPSPTQVPNETEPISLVL